MTHEILPITLADARDEFQKLDDLTCETLKKMPPKSKVGNDAVDYFTYQERLNTKGNKHISFFDLYTNKNFYMEKTYVKNILAYLKKNSPNKSDLQVWRSIMGLYFGMPHIFKPLVAMEFYCRFKPKSVLDFTMGWGGRLLGACALDVPHYIGIDMNDKLRQPYEQMVKMVEPMTDTKITLMFKDALTVDYGKLDYDMVFTSPPYYNIELYNKTTQQSKDDWDANFYDPIIRKTFAGLKMGGHYCLNIPAEVYDRVALKILGGADIKVPLNKTQRQAVAFKGGTAYTELVYIWVKKGQIEGGAITTYKDKFNKKYGFDEDQTHSIADIAKISGYKKDGLETIYDKGVGAYHTNPQSVRPTVKSPEQWAMARIYSVIMGGKAKKIDASHLIKGEGFSNEVKEYEKIFKQYPDVFPSGYFRFLRTRLQKHIKNGTLIYKNGVILTYMVYQNSVKKTADCVIKKGDVKLDQIVNKNQGNGAAKKVVEDFLTKFKTNKIWLEVRDDNKRAIQFYKDRGFKKVGDISFGKDIGGVLMLKK
jgi:hypothetical protein